MEYLEPKYQEYYVPYSNVSVDESTIGFKEKIAFKTYNPKKPIKWGLRVFVLSDSTNGYIYSMLPYYGRYTRELLNNVSNLSYTANIVIHLCRSLQKLGPSSGYHIFTDRFYSSHSLSSALRQMDRHHTGTLLPNRKGNPPEVKKRQKLKLYESKSFKCSDEMVLLWRDERNVLMVSNYYDNTMEKVSRKTAATTEKFLKPKVIVEYTKNMGGVETNDHYCASYLFLRKSVKWWRKMFFWMLETAIVNSYIVYKETSERKGKRPQSHLQFRRALLVQFVGGLRNPKNKREGSQEPETRKKD